MSKVQIVTIKKPKGRARGKPFEKGNEHAFDSKRAAEAQAKRKTFSGGSAKISIAYAMLLSEEAPDDVKAAVGIAPDQKATWSDLIAYQAGKRALGLVESDKINFTAIQEMREVTEGRVADKVESSGPNGTPLTAPPVFQVNFVKAKREAQERRDAEQQAIDDGEKRSDAGASDDEEEYEPAE